MTTLTWRDVAAPDFSPAMEGYKQFSNMLGNAFGGLDKGIERFDNAKTDRVNSALMASIAAAQNPDAAKALAENIATDPNRGRFSSASYEALMARPGDLTKQASDESDLAYTTNTRADIIAKRDALTNATPIIRQVAMLRDQGKADEASKLMAEHADVFGGVSNDDFFRTMRDLQSTSTTDTANRSSRHNYDTGVRDDTENRQVIELQELATSLGIDKADHESFFRTHYDELIGKGYSPVVISRARHGALNDPTADASFFDEGAAGSSSAAGGGVGSGDPTRVMNYVAQGKGIPAIPDEVQTLGQWSDWAAGLNNKGIKETAGGVFQIVGSTLRSYAPRALGSNWQSLPLTAANQDKVAEAVFNDNRGSAAALKKQWVSLSLADAERVRKLPWAQARNIIAQGESGVSDVKALLAQQAQNFEGQAGPEYNRSQDPAQVFATQAVALFNDSSNARQVASKLTSDGGELKGENVGNVAGKIDKIAQDYGISPALAGLVLTNSLGGNQGLLGRAADALHVFGVGDGLNADVKAGSIKEFATLAKNRQALIDKAKAAQANSQSAQLAASASQASAAAQQRAQNRAATAERLGRKIDPSGAIAEAAAAENLRGQTLVNSAEVTAAGGNQPDPAPQRSQGGNGAPTSNNAPAVRAQSFLERKFQEMIPDKAGALQMQGVKERFKQQYGISIEQVRSNPNLAWQAAKRVDSKAAELIQRSAQNNRAYFSR